MRRYDRRTFFVIRIREMGWDTPYLARLATARVMVYLPWIWP